MHLVQMLLPIYDNRGDRIPGDAFQAVRRELTDEFGGVTMYTRSPASGAWKDEQGAVARDDVIMVEVVVEQLDTGWWARYRQTLEQRFLQETVLARAFRIERL